MGTGRSRGRPKKKSGEPKSPYTMTVARMKRDNEELIQNHVLTNDEDIQYNRRLIAHALEVSSLAPAVQRPYRVEDIPLLQESFINYLQACDKNGMRPGSIAVCSAMGISTRTFFYWVEGKRGKEFQEFASTVQQILATIREDMISDGKLNPVIGIFWQRNFDSLRNDTEQIQSANETNVREEFTTVSEIKKRYGDLLKE